MPSDIKIVPTNFKQRSSLALVHDWLFGLRGGERCLQAFLCLYERADVFALFAEKGKTHAVIDANLQGSSFANSLPKIRSYYRGLLPLFPIISSIHALKDYPIRISLSHAASKNIRGSSKITRHICYCFTPMRYIWDQANRYLGWKAIFAWPLIALLRFWDRRGSGRVTDFIAISTFVAARIRRYYGRRATVIFPPVASGWIDASKSKIPADVSTSESAYLFAGALVPYKGAELAIRACSEMGRELWVAGDGPERARLEALAGPKTKFLGKVSDPELAHLLLHCRALIFPCKEDFGILPLEAQAAGKVVVALHAGACKETIKGVKPWVFGKEQNIATNLAIESYTGVFIRQSRNDADQREEVKRAIAFFEINEGDFTSEACTRQAALFNPESFYETWRKFALNCPGLRDVPMANKADFVARFEMLRSQT